MDKKAEVLTDAIKKEKNMRVCKRLITVSMITLDGMPVQRMADRFGVSARTVREWVKRYKKYGVEGLYDIEIPGSPPKIEYKKIHREILTLDEMGMLEPKKLRSIIYEIYGVCYSLCQIRRILRKLNYSPKVASSTFANKASKWVVGTWQRCLKQITPRLKYRGYMMVEQDESLFVNKYHRGKKRWSPIGKKTNTKQTGGHEKIVVYGALAEDGTQLFRTYEHFNAETFVKYLEEMRIKWGKIVVILDNAPQHTAKIVQRYLKEHKKEVILHFLPVSSPELNAVEECWRQAKYEILVAKYYPGLKDMWEVVSEYFRVTRFYLDIYRYLERSV